MNKSSKDIVAALIKTVNDSDAWEAASMMAEYIGVSSEFIDAMYDTAIVDREDRFCRFCERRTPIVDNVCVGCCIDTRNAH